MSMFMYCTYTRSRAQGTGHTEAGGSARGSKLQVGGRRECVGMQRVRVEAADRDLWRGVMLRARSERLRTRNSSSKKSGTWKPRANASLLRWEERKQLRGTLHSNRLIWNGWKENRFGWRRANEHSDGGKTTCHEANHKWSTWWDAMPEKKANEDISTKPERGLFTKNIAAVHLDDAPPEQCCSNGPNNTALMSRTNMSVRYKYERNNYYSNSIQ